MLFICPKCKENLIVDDNRAVCKNGHSYDKSRWGYFNLLLSVAGGVHGDNKDMVIARRQFLSKGYYEPLAKRIAEIICSVSPENCALLDAGAGEGYYTDFIEKALFLRDGRSSVSAFDISKDAVKEISKKNSRISLAVCGSYHMPIRDGSFDVVVNTFSPLALEETRRVLRSGGIFVMAIPGEMHLFDLKSLIYDTPYKNVVEDAALPGFELVSLEKLSYTMRLECKEDVETLFKMTPYAYRTKSSDREKIEKVSALDCRADFRIFVYRKEE